MNIDFDLEDVQGIKSAKTSYASQVCEVIFDEGKVDVKTIFGVIEKIGYKIRG